MITEERDAIAAALRRWPAYALAVLCLGYAAGKAVFAAQSRLGFPGGPPVAAVEHERYGREVMDVATAQWLGAATGVLGALIVLASVTAIGRRVPRVAMLILLAGVLVGLGPGATVMVLDGFVGLGVGWSPAHGVVGVIAWALLVATIGSYLRAASVRSRGGSACPWPGRAA